MKNLSMILPTALIASLTAGAACTKNTNRSADPASSSQPGITTASRDINTMNKDEFVAMGLSELMAERVLQERSRKGGFNSIADLEAIPGMDTPWLNAHRGELTISSAGMADQDY